MFEYYSNSTLKSVTDYLSGSIAMQYDQLDRMTNSSGVAPSGTVGYAYLPGGQVTTVVSVAGTSVYTHDAAERLLRLKQRMVRSVTAILTTTGSLRR